MLPAVWCDSEVRALATEDVLIKLESPECNVVDRVGSMVGGRCKIKGKGKDHHHGFACPSSNLQAFAVTLGRAAGTTGRDPVAHRGAHRRRGAYGPDPRFSCAADGGPADGGVLAPRFPHPRAGYRSAQDLSSSCRSRRVLIAPQKAEQLVEVPTTVSYSSLRGIEEQNADISVPPGRGGLGVLQEFRLGQDSTAFGGADHVDFPIPHGRGGREGGGSLQGLRPGQSSTAFDRADHVGAFGRFSS